ncbi:hypothetical protein C8J56DRAFT_936959 [Mycena floridula]|nr:hypothetical protein C8J56DRAFT_936959 [Mycena floridula]
MEPQPAADAPLLGGTLSPSETWWRDHCDWLLQLGYQLRPRFRPGWVPSWKANLDWLKSEDAQGTARITINDALVLSDRRKVVLKQVTKGDPTQELSIATMVSRPPLSEDPRNHCIPVLDVLETPDKLHDIMVMPLLRLHDDPLFCTVGEVIGCIGEILEGLQFMHHHHIAHRDCTRQNIMMDATMMYPSGFHPAKQRMRPDYKGLATHYSRTERPPRYYLIDFGLSGIYRPEDGPPLEHPVHGGDKTVPEFQGEGYKIPANPFATDIYYIGNWIRVHFIDGDTRVGAHRFYFGMHGLDFLRPFIQDLVQPEPSKRPNIDEVVNRFAELRDSLSQWRLRSPVVSKDPYYAPRSLVFHTIRHYVWTLGIVIRRYPAIPVHSP